MDQGTGKAAEVARILIAEKDAEMRSLIAEQLRSTGLLMQLAVEEASTGPEAISKIKSHSYDLCICDAILPELSGVDFIRNARLTRTPAELAILIVTASEDVDTHLRLIEAGANDYLLKPFDRNTLLSRVSALLKRFKPADTELAQKVGRLILGELTLDTRSYDAYCGSDRIHLTPSEFKLLHTLAISRGTVLTREQLIEQVQGEGIAVIDRAIDTHIFGLRKKLCSCADAIETVRGVGYRIKA